jgi:hypothetical protein
VEIVSPSRPIDYREKFIEYQSAGVPEYWIIDPEREYAEFWQLDDTGAYRVAYAGSEGVYRSRELQASGCAWSGFGDSSLCSTSCANGASCRRVSNRCQPPMGSNQSSIDSRRMALDSH